MAFYFTVLSAPCIISHETELFAMSDASRGSF
jgi:hypothetical protein